MSRDLLCGKVVSLKDTHDAGYMSANHLKAFQELFCSFDFGQLGKRESVAARDSNLLRWRALE